MNLARDLKEGISKKLKHIINNIISGIEQDIMNYKKNGLKNIMNKTNS